MYPRINISIDSFVLIFVFSFIQRPRVSLAVSLVSRRERRGGKEAKAGVSGTRREEEKRRNSGEKERDTGEEGGGNVKSRLGGRLFA